MQYTFRFRRRVSGEDRILQAMIAAFFLLTPLIILILRKLFMREMF
ncbi:hypothetical protein GK584_16695, partial [Shigella flexneri]|nr:hypothetical protein [Shigella flexneri]